MHRLKYLKVILYFNNKIIHLLLINGYGVNIVFYSAESCHIRLLE